MIRRLLNRLVAHLDGYLLLALALLVLLGLVVLYSAHEYLFSALEPSGSKPYASLALAIAVATANNFTWNRLWTWSDRLGDAAGHARPGQAAQTGAAVFLAQFWRYTLASWFGIALQYGLTLWLAQSLHYLLANVIAIVIASVSNFLANDRWTFRRRSRK